jgi:hypothetical protein
MKLYLGVDQVPEWQSNWDTYDLGKHLEEKYGLFSKFYEMDKEKIAKYIEEGIEGALSTYQLTGQMPADPLPSVGTQIVKDFQDMIDQKKFDNVLPNVPTKASKIGIRRRFKNRLDPNRPSFQDTGIFEASLEAWIK